MEVIGCFFCCLFAGLLPVTLVAYLVRSFGPVVLSITCNISSVVVAALWIYLLGDAPFLSGTHLFIGAIILAGGLVATRMVFTETKYAAINLVAYEARVNDLLENHWHCLDEQGVGFLSQTALRWLDHSSEQGTKFQRVVKHMHTHFNDIAISSAGTGVITPAVAHNYITAVRVKYAKWLQLAEQEEKRHVCSSQCPTTCGARTTEAK